MSDEPTQLLDNEGEYVYDTDADDNQMLVDRIPQTSSTSAMELRHRLLQAIRLPQYGRQLL